MIFYLIWITHFLSQKNNNFSPYYKGFENPFLICEIIFLYQNLFFNIGEWINTANIDAEVTINSTHIVEIWHPDVGRYIHLFIFTFIYLFVNSFVHFWFIHLFTYSFLYLFIYFLFICSFVHLLIYSFVYLFIYSFIH